MAGSNENITIELVADGNIEQCRELCNALMAFQKSQAVLSPESFDQMTYETRLKASYDNSPVSQLVVAKDCGVPVGYVFSTIENVSSGDKSSLPDWAPQLGDEMKGFYPDWAPDKVGCLNHLYFDPAYRGRGLGSLLLGDAMAWLESFDDVGVTFVYISNGNKAALDFYLKNGFVFSHDVFGGFIQAAYKKKCR